MKRIALLMGILLLGTFLLACATKTIPLEKPKSQEAISQETQAAAKERWEAEWYKLIKAAQKEGTVVIYSGQSSNEMRQAMTRTMAEKFSIQLDMVVGKGADLLPKVARERMANLFSADMFLGGGALNFKPFGFLEPLEPALILPDVIDDKYWIGGKFPWLDKEHYGISFFGGVNAPITINTSLVKPTEIKSYYDLLNSKWKGKIIMNDPTISGAASSNFDVIGWDILNLDFFYQLTKQDLVVMRDPRLMVDWTARGKYAILLFANTSIVREYKDAGSPLALLTPKEGTYLSSGGGNISMFKNTPHPNATKVLINWLLSREGQTVVSNAKGVQSLRVDVKTEGVDPAEVRQEGVKYLLEPSKDDFARREERIKIAGEIFGPFIIK